MIDETTRDLFPPILLFRDPDDRLWLADGHHRVAAAIRAIVQPGTKADAIWEAAKANARNGLPLFGSDYRRAVPMLAEAWPDRSNVMIAEALGCSEGTVRYHLKQVRKVTNLAQKEEPVEKRVVGKDGKSYPPRPKVKKVLSQPSESEAGAYHKRQETNEKGSTIQLHDNFDPSELAHAIICRLPKKDGDVLFLQIVADFFKDGGARLDLTASNVISYIFNHMTPEAQKVLLGNMLINMAKNNGEAAAEMLAVVNENLGKQPLAVAAH